MDENLRGKAAVVTGGTSGIGLAIARRLRDAGAQVVVVGRRQAEVDRTVSELGEGASGRACDVTDDQALSQLFAELEHLDLRFTCAGGTLFGTVEEVTPDDMRELFATRVFGQMVAAHYTVPRMGNSGAIVFCSGIGDVVGLVPYSAGCAVDGAINAFARSLAPDSMTGASETASLPVGNSVVGPPSKVTVTPDGRHAIVIETLQGRPASGEDVGLAGLKPGRTITVVDLSDPARPSVVQELRGPARADSISISSDGAMVVVAVHPGGDGVETPLWLYRFANGRLDEGRAVAVPNWTRGHRLIDAAFHPTHPLLALVDETGRELAMDEVDPATLRLTQWGNKVEIEKGPYNAHYTPDVRFVLLTATYADTIPRQVPNGFPAGTVYSIRLDAQKDKDGNPQHFDASRAATSNEPEGLAITPDGRFAVTINLERATFPIGDPRRRPYTSLTLLAIDRETGYLRRIGDFAFDGILPEAAAFDRTGRMLAVANYSKLNDPTGNGSIDFWRLVKDEVDPARNVLVRTQTSVPV